jgi:hypothetical protein
MSFAGKQNGRAKSDLRALWRGVAAIQLLGSGNFRHVTAKKLPRTGIVQTRGQGISFPNRASYLLTDGYLQATIGPGRLTSVLASKADIWPTRSNVRI